MVISTYLAFGGIGRGHLGSYEQADVAAVVIVDTLEVVKSNNLRARQQPSREVR